MAVFFVECICSSFCPASSYPTTLHNEMMARLGGLFTVEGLTGHSGSPMTPQAPSSALKLPFAIYNPLDQNMMMMMVGLTSHEAPFVSTCKSPLSSSKTASFNDQKGNPITMCGSKKYSYLPHGRDFFLYNPPSPHLSGNSSQASYINLRFWPLRAPSPPRNFQSLLWGEYGYFLELHSNVWRVTQYRNTINTLKSYGPTKVHL